MGVEVLSDLIAGGMWAGTELATASEETRKAIEGLFGQRYAARSAHGTRVALRPADDAVSFAGLVHEDSPTSGVYGGMSLIWFPVASADGAPASSLITFVCGTRGLAPDEQIMGRPGHARHLQALRRYLGKEVSVPVWVKHDPTNLTEPMPKVVREQYPQFSAVFNRYGNYIYAAAQVPEGEDEASRSKARAVVTAFLDFYAWERGWAPLKEARGEVETLKDKLRANLFPRMDEEEICGLLKERRFVILQGPPGTGKTRLAINLLEKTFGGRGLAVQFHPAVTYETFVAGIAPAVEDDTLHFKVSEGWLARAVREAGGGGRDYLLVIDEVNRGDLGRVLGEAIYLFEARDIAHEAGRRVTLPHRLANGRDSLAIPPNLYLLGTMNSADRSIAILDLAVRRRFAFVDVWPDLKVVAAQGRPLATEAFGRLQDIFAQYAPDEALVLLPGHAYFLADSDGELEHRLRYELMPLLGEYLQEGRLGPCEGELRAYLGWLESELAQTEQRDGHGT
ncbi:MAG: McrB family protein [Bacillota bacterium]